VLYNNIYGGQRALHSDLEFGIDDLHNYKDDEDVVTWRIILAINFSFAQFCMKVAKRTSM
jgi:hypothetical protein